jgi:glyoxylase-like metal-dependent hydrolase (beta-lactamase superfamily II)
MKVTEDVYAIDSTSGNYAYVILKPQVILIDTGRPGQGKSILHELADLQVKPDDIRHILLTHHDGDHTGSAGYLQRASAAKVWISETDLPFLKREMTPTGIKRYISKLMRVEIPNPIETYSQAGEIEGIQMIPTPGHTPGHVCLLYKEVLFAGDLVVNLGGRLRLSPPIMTWDGDLVQASAREVGKLRFHWVCPAHGAPIDRGSLWENLFS